MNVQAIRKAICLIFVYILIIIGIFILQFRTDSTIIEKIGSLQITLSKNEETDSLSPEEKSALPAIKNKLIANYNGLSFSCDDQNPVKIALKNSTELKPVQLIDYSKKDEYSVELQFTDEVKITFDMLDNSQTSSLFISTILPNNVKAVYIPYSYALTMNILKEEENRIIFDSKKKSWILSGYELSDGLMCLTRQSTIGSYAIYDETKKFSFDSITDLEIASAEVYSSTIENFKNNLIAAYKADNSSAKTSEQIIVSYVAAQAEKGKYNEAIEEIPQSFKKSSSRTWLSAPYFNNLSSMDKKLESDIKDKELRIAKAASNPSLDIFTVHNIADSLAVYQTPEHIRKITDYVNSADIENASISEVSGLLTTYVQLYSIRPEIAVLLEPVMGRCIDRIAAACAFENNVITISENDTFLSVVQAVEIGTSILRYGQITDNLTLIKAGRVLINSYMSESSSFDLRTLSNLYPYAAYDNWYYPHVTVIDSKDSEIEWAWTCAKSISKTRDTAENSITYTIDFPEGSTHYVMMKNIPQFDSIYIYDMAFRTDPRFESYNSSGYIYKAETGSLLLKSRHKKQMETVRLMVSKNQTRPAPAAETKVSETKKAESETASADTKTSSQTAAVSASSASSSAAPKTEQTQTAAPAEKAVSQPETPAVQETAAETPAAATETPAETPAAAEAAPAPSEQTSFDVYITAYDASQKRNVISVLRKLTKHTSNSSTKLLDAVESDGEQLIQSGFTSEKADELIEKLAEYGCTAIKR